MEKNLKKSIGVLGGMGPDASAYFYKILIDKARSNFHAVKNEDYPDIILHSVPVPDFITNQKHINKALSMLKESVKHIAPFCSVVGIACNTAHLLLDELQSIIDTPFISIIEETAKYIKKSGYKQIGLLATPTTFRLNLYQKAFKNNGVRIFIPESSEIDELGKIVNAIVSGNFSKTTTSHIKKIADNLISRGAKAIVLGCTELPIIFPSNYQVPVVNSLDVLANRLLAYYYGRR